jgi:hypothetical protein
MKDLFVISTVDKGDGQCGVEKSPVGMKKADMI